MGSALTTSMRPALLGVSGNVGSVLYGRRQPTLVVVYIYQLQLQHKAAAIIHLFLDVFVRRRRNDRKADEKDIRLRIAQWTESVIVFLSSSIKQTQCVRLSTDHHRHSIVVKHLQVDNVTHKYSTK